MTSCFVYKVMGLTFHNKINTQLIYRFELAQVVARRITKRLGSNLTGCSFLFIFYCFFLFFWGGGGWGLILLFSSCLIFFNLFIIIIFIFYPSRNGKITLLFTVTKVNHALITNVDVANMSFNAIRGYFRIYSSLFCYRCLIYVLYTC